ncbi:MAG: hypothetical protein JWM56_211 [Candidatus Peribacteria bacterium]|nr:hypothetical protein [Candidatus Peribacteria bacterium]
MSRRTVIRKIFNRPEWNMEYSRKKSRNKASMILCNIFIYIPNHCMKKRVRALSAGMIVSLVCLPLSQVHAALSQKSVTISPNWNGDFISDSFKQSVRDAKDVNVNMITLVLPFQQANPWSTDIWKAANAPSDDVLGQAIDYIHSIGLQVTLKPHLDPTDGNWRAQINPGDRDSWFRNYKNSVLLPLASLGQSHGVEEIIIGTELAKMASDSVNPTNSTNWRGMIREMKNTYSGQLTYSAQHDAAPDNTNEKSNITFWKDLNSIGISAYHPVATWTGNPTSQDVKSSLQQWYDTELKPISQQYGKPILFSEIGYRSVDGANYEPSSYWRDGNYNPQEQSALTQGMCEFVRDNPGLIGAHIWDWKSDPNAGGPGNKDYTVQNKPSEDVLRNCFGGNAGSSPAGGNSNPGPQSTSFTTTATVPGNPAAGQVINGSVTIQNAVAQPAGGINVDIEIYDSAGSPMFQKVFMGESFTANQSKQYPFDWSTGKQGTYVVKIGVFDSSWSTNFVWNNEAAKFTVGALNPPPNTTPNPSPAPTPAPGPSGSIEVWWVGNGQTVSGQQPFKALLTQGNVDQYEMYWTVDGGPEVKMYNTNQDYPHKEFMVDLNPWTWRGNNGTYAVTYIARSNNGTEIARQTVNMTVIH